MKRRKYHDFSGEIHNYLEYSRSVLVVQIVRGCFHDLLCGGLCLAGQNEFEAEARAVEAGGSRQVVQLEVNLVFGKYKGGLGLVKVGKKQCMRYLVCRLAVAKVRKPAGEALTGERGELKRGKKSLKKGYPI